MYNFVDTTEVAPSTSMSIQTIFGNNNLDKLLTDESGSFKTLTVSGRAEQVNRFNTVTIGGRDGVYEEDDKKLDPREITVKFKLKDDTNEGFRERADRLKGLLYRQKERLTFPDEEYIYYATLSSLEMEEEETNDVVGFIHFFCSDPYKYSPETRIELNGNIEIESPAGVIPIFNIEFTENTSEFSIRHKQTRRHLKVKYDFGIGDKLSLNAVNRRVQINGITRMQTLTWDSAWFELVNGNNVFEITQNVGNVELRYRERWL